MVVIKGKIHSKGSYKGVGYGEREGPRSTSVSSEEHTESDRIEHLQSPKQLPWRGEKSDKYYILPTQNLKKKGIVIEN